MDIVKVTFNDNTVHEYRKGTLFYDASKDFVWKILLVIR